MPRLSTSCARSTPASFSCVARDTPEPSPFAHESSTRGRTRSWTMRRSRSGGRRRCRRADRATSPGRCLGALDASRSRGPRGGAARSARRRRAARRAADGRIPDDAEDARQRMAGPLPRRRRRRRAAVASQRVATRDNLGRGRATARDPRGPPRRCDSIRRSPRPPRAPRRVDARRRAPRLCAAALALLGPVAPAQLGAPLGVRRGATSRRAAGRSSPRGRAARLLHARRGPQEWCDRRLLARIHRYTLNRLRAEIQPVTPAEFMRFLFAWQHVSPAHALAGADGLARGHRAARWRGAAGGGVGRARVCRRALLG